MALAGDHHGLLGLAAALDDLGWPGEGNSAGSAPTWGRRRTAAQHFADAAANVRLVQPPCRALALVCEAQLRDALDEGATALDLLRTAVVVTEVRGNAVPFLAGRGRVRRPTSSREAEAEPGTVGRPAGRGHARSRHERRPRPVDGHTRGTPARPRHGRASGPQPSRARRAPRAGARSDVYADIAAALYLSENTVKTHVSSLYGKLGVRRRSDALAVARSLDLL